MHPHYNSPLKTIFCTGAIFIHINYLLPLRNISRNTPYLLPIRKKLLTPGTRKTAM